jgi:biotin/methionine sulfoxide reductase
LTASTRSSLTSTHWGLYKVSTQAGALTEIEPFAHDPDPSPIGRSILDGVTASARVRRPAVRAGYLRDRGKSRDERGKEPFVEVHWDTALDLVAEEIARIRQEDGNKAIFGGSYGWASAGRFHHAQGQLHRFLNCAGGYVRHVNSYSTAAAEVVLPHIVGPMDDLLARHTSFANLEKHCELFVAFGGLPTKNAQVGAGGVSKHVVRHALERMSAAGVEFINVSPLRSDLADVPDAEWWALRPGSDTALMLGLAHVLITEGLSDQDFVQRYSVGFDTWKRYILGDSDGVPKNVAWAAKLTEIPAFKIHDLAHRMVRHRTMINVAWSLQRAEHGEQPFWAAVGLATLLGQIGLPGGGFGVGYSTMHPIGATGPAFSGPRFPQGQNPIAEFIPVSRIADMLLQPGSTIDYNGSRLVYPDIRMIYWAGGNAFHHHQNINKLIEAWRRPDTVVVHEPFWTAQARFADIVLPCTTALERNDIGSAWHDSSIVAMKAAIEPVGSARDDYTIFAGLAARLGFGDRFTEGRTIQDWLRHLYEESRPRAEAAGLSLPDFDAFWEAELIEFPQPNEDIILLQEFRDDPAAFPLPTPSGRLELFSDRVAGFGYRDCRGHAAWIPPTEWLGSDRAQTYPLHLLSNQPRTRLHSQYDHGAYSRDSKIAGREPITINAVDAQARGIRQGDVVRVFNDRGQTLAGAILSEDIRPGVVQLSTGAWYDPAVPGQLGSLDRHGNPNVLTQDRGASSLSQGPVAQSNLVEIERFVGDTPKVTIFSPPAFMKPE